MISGPLKIKPTLVILFAITLTCFQISSVVAQANKKVEKAVKVFNSGKQQKGIDLMQKVVDGESTDKNWDVLVDMYRERYETGKRNGIEVLLLSLSKSLDPGVKLVTSDLSYFGSFISKCREAGLYSESGTASQLLRNFLVDHSPDTAISENAQKEFNEAEESFNKKDYNTAKLHYLKALKIKPDYYKATIYAGDSYWYLKNMDSAIYYFKKGIEMDPNLLEPRKYLVDALNYDNKIEEARHECLNAICVYPDEGMFAKLGNISDKEGRKFNKHWMKRGCDVNSFKPRHTDAKDDIWHNYQSAFEEIKTYSDSSGILSPNPLTKTKYLEVYSWEKILSSSTPLPAEFAFVQRIKEAGFLDCYVFISMYHFDLYSQYADFVEFNKEKIKLYMETYLME